MSRPIWPGQPIIAHWGVPDPALAEGNDEKKLWQFKRAAQSLSHHITLFCALPLEKLDRVKLTLMTREIGEGK